MWWRRGIRVAAAAFAVGLSVAPQHASAAPADYQDAVLTGRVLNENGTPAARAQVSVGRYEPNGFTRGHHRVGGQVTATDDKGQYRLVLPAAVIDGVETDTDYIVTARPAASPDEGSGPYASYELELLHTRHRSPDLVLWDPAVQTTVGEDAITFRHRANPDYAYSVGLTLNGRAIDMYGLDESDFVRNSERENYSTTRIDTRFVEDGQLTIRATGNFNHTDNGTIYHVQFGGSPHALRGVRVPPSRGKACFSTHTGGATVSRPGCTDGDFFGAVANDCTYDFDGKPIGFEPAGGCPGELKSLTVDLGAVADVGFVRVNCPGCQRAASVDGVSWVPIPADGARDGVAGRFVRVSDSYSPSLENLQEISVWPPGPPPPNSPTAVNAKPFASPVIVVKPRLVLRLFAALALLVAVAALVFRTTRRAA